MRKKKNRVEADQMGGLFTGTCVVYDLMCEVILFHINIYLLIQVRQRNVQ
jgi:hypothetical protein